MTLEQLNMIKRLQPFFKERMGEWQVGDEFYPIAFDSHYQLFVIDRGNLDIVDQFGNQLHMADVLCIPQVYNRKNPERCLWGMVDWDMWILSTGIGNANVYIRSADCDIKDDPFTALLKALCEQEEV